MSLEKIQVPIVAKLCKCISFKKEKVVVGENQSEFYQVYEDLPKDLLKFKKLLLREKYQAFLAHTGQLSI